MDRKSDLSSDAPSPVQRPIPRSGKPADPSSVRKKSIGSNVPSGPQRAETDPEWGYRPPYSVSPKMPIEPNRIPFVGMGGYRGMPELLDRGLWRDWEWLKRPIAQMRRHGYTVMDVAAMFSVHPNAVFRIYKQWGWKSDREMGIKRVKTKRTHLINKERFNATNHSQGSPLQEQ